MALENGGAFYIYKISSIDTSYYGANFSGNTALNVRYIYRLGKM